MLTPSLGSDGVRVVVTSRLSRIRTETETLPKSVRAVLSRKTGDSLQPSEAPLASAQAPRIAEVGPSLSVETEVRLDASGRILVPGLVNAHTHGHNNLARGSAQRWTLESLLNYGFALQSNRTPDDHYVSAAIGAIEMLKSG